MAKSNAAYQNDIDSVCENALEMTFNAKLHLDYSSSPEAQRALALATTKFEEGLMWFHKAGYYDNVNQHLNEEK